MRGELESQFAARIVDVHSLSCGFEFYRPKRPGSKRPCRMQQSELERSIPLRFQQHPKIRLSGGSHAEGQGSTESRGWGPRPATLAHIRPFRAILGMVETQTARQAKGNPKGQNSKTPHTAKKNTVRIQCQQHQPRQQVTYLCAQRQCASR